MSVYRLKKYADGDGDPIDSSDARSILDIIESLTKERDELKLLLQGADLTCNRIAEIVGYTGQYRDLVEAVEVKLAEK